MIQKITIIVPAYNEEKNILAGSLERIRNWILLQEDAIELLIVDDGSTDHTASLASEYGRVISIPHGGKAAAITTGIIGARGDVILFTDCDQSTPIEESTKLLHHLFIRSGDIAIGSRAERIGAPLSRRIMGASQVFIRSFLLGMGLKDTQCGFKAFNRLAALHIIQNMKVYSISRLDRINGPAVNSGWDVEFLYVAQRLGYRIIEEPVIWVHRSSSRVSIIRDSWRGLLDLLKIFRAQLFGRYSRLTRAAPIRG